MPGVRKFSLQSAEQYEELFGGSNSTADLIQLSSGLLGFETTLINFHGVHLEWNRFTTRVRVRETYRGSGLMFGFPIQGSCRPNLCGQEMDYGASLVWRQNEEVEYMLPPATTTLIIWLDDEIVESMGWTLVGGRQRLVSRLRLRNLEEICRIATKTVIQSAQSQSETETGSRTQPRRDNVIWRDQILVALEAALESWLEPQPVERCAGKRYFQLVRNAERLLEQHDPNQAISANSVATALGVPKRTLFHAFRNSMGVGPHAYLRFVRIHQLRKSLMNATLGETSVTHLANELGFHQLGRLSGLYKAQFGELPSETLKREPSQRKQSKAP